MNEEEQFSFIAEWYDTNASLIRRYMFLYYPKDGSVEMYDIKNHRTFLKRTKYEELGPEDLFVGSIITVYARQLRLVGYGDQYTARRLGSKKQNLIMASLTFIGTTLVLMLKNRNDRLQRTLGVIKPSTETKLGNLIDQIYKSGLVITKAKMIDLTSDLLQYLSCGPAVALEILGDEAVSAWKKLIESGGANRAQNEASVRALYGIGDVRNNVYGSECAATAAQELEVFFPSPGRGPLNTAKCIDCTLCIIKPHAIAEGLAGKILSTIEEMGFNYSALQMFNVERANAEEFLEVYKGVVAEYNGMVMELCSGPCLALELQGKEIQKLFRECCGPSDPVCSQDDDTCAWTRHEGLHTLGSSGLAQGTRNGENTPPPQVEKEKQRKQPHRTVTTVADQRGAQRLRDPHRLQVTCGRGTHTSCELLEACSWEPGIGAGIQEGAEGKKSSQRASAAESFLIVGGLDLELGLPMDRTGVCAAAETAGGKSTDTHSEETLFCLSFSHQATLMATLCLPYIRQ